MSGPKTTSYTLTAEQRANLLAQNRCDSEILSCIGQINRVIMQFNPSLAEIEVFEGAGSEESVKMTAELKEVKDALENRRDRVKAAFSSLAQYERPATAILTEAELERKKKILAKLREIKSETDILLGEIETATAKSKKIHSDVAKDIEENLEGSFSLSWKLKEFDYGREDVDKDEVLNVIKALLDMTLSEELKKRAENALAKLAQIDSDDFLKNFSAVTVKPLVKDCKQYVEMVEKYDEIFNDLYARYIALCEMLGVEKKKFELSESSCKALEAEITMLEEDLYQNEEESYIADCIDEVMEEMGYSLIGSREVTKRSGKRFRDELYTFSEGTAVNIRYDSEGKIAMELGGIDTTDRVPTESETAKLCDDMVEFCDKFTEFERRLAQRGIVCKERISHFPPEAEHAQIINASDYELTQEVETIKAERRQIRKEGQKQARND